MVHTVKVKREDIPKELQMLLESSMLHLLMLHGNPLPPEAWKFAASIPKMADATLEKWEEYAQPYM